jgi:hypothetical protein
VIINNRAEGERKGTMSEPVREEGQPTSASVARRISTLLAGLERARREPNRRESYYIRSALEMLATDRLVEADEAAIKAALAAPLPAHVASLVQTNELGTIEQFRTALERTQAAR